MGLSTKRAVVLRSGCSKKDSVARLLRQEPELPGVELVALTGYGRAEDRQRAREAGFDDHLTKPVDAQELKNLLVARLGR
jgi:CheY-like chemotaxis protein